MWVKICGITNLEDALCAIESGADALGFVFYPKSPRYIEPQNAFSIAQQIPSGVKKIGLFVEVSPEEINETCKEAGMDMAQIHFDVDKSFWSALKVPFYVLFVQKAKKILINFKDSFALLMPMFLVLEEQVNVWTFHGLSIKIVKISS